MVLIYRNRTVNCTGADRQSSHIVSPQTQDLSKSVFSSLSHRTMPPQHFLRELGVSDTPITATLPETLARSLTQRESGVASASSSGIYNYELSRSINGDLLLIQQSVESGLRVQITTAQGQTYEVPRYSLDGFPPAKMIPKQFFEDCYMSIIRLSDGHMKVKCSLRLRGGMDGGVSVNPDFGKAAHGARLISKKGIFYGGAHNVSSEERQKWINWLLAFLAKYSIDNSRLSRSYRSLVIEALKTQQTFRELDPSSKDLVKSALEQYQKTL